MIYLFIGIGGALGASLRFYFSNFLSQFLLFGIPLGTMMANLIGCFAIGFFISGKYLNVNLPLSVGFINIPAFLIFVPITTFMARVGAKKSHTIDKQKLTKYFGFFFLVVWLLILLVAMAVVVLFVLLLFVAFGMVLLWLVF